MGKWKIKLILLITGLNIIGLLAIIPYELTLMNYQSAPEGISPLLIMTINSTIQAIYMFIMILIGIRLQERTNLGTPILDGIVYHKKWNLISIKEFINMMVITLIGTLIVLLLELFVFEPLIESPVNQAASPSWWQGLLAALYGGFTEEIMVRLFGMTLIVWLLTKITKKEKDNIPNSFYYTSIILTTLLFGLGHLPTTFIAFNGLTGILVLRAIVLNGLLGLWFGYLYWKKGLEYAIIAHIFADILLHVVFI